MIEESRTAPIGMRSLCLSCDVKVMQSEKLIIASIVWFERLDNVDRRDARTLQSSINSGFGFFGAVEDREHRICGGLSHIGFDKLPSKMIKAGSKIMDDIAYDDSQSVRRLEQFSGRSRYLKDPISGLRLIIGNDWIKLAGSNFNFEIVDGLFGPRDLCLDRRYARDCGQMLYILLWFQAPIVRSDACE